jgi:hypothetical protein
MIYDTTTSRWRIVTGSGSSPLKSVVSTGSSMSVTHEEVVACTAGSITITLPAVATAGIGRQIIVKDRDGNAGAGNITIDGNASETIDGATTFSLTVNYQSVTLVNDGSTWMVV